MNGLDYFTFFIFGVIGTAGVIAFVILGGMPGKIARERHHPQSEAINVAGWLGVITMGVLWPFALIWAYTNQSPASSSATGGEAVGGIQELKSEIAELRSQLEKTTGTEKSGS